jgi:hypothetical protein
VLGLLELADSYGLVLAFEAMEPWMWAIVLKPFALIVLFGFTLAVTRAIKPYIPEGRLKRFLYFSWKV